MNCEKVKELAPELHDSALDEIQKELIRVHTATCAVCRLELERLRSLSEMLRQTPAPLPSAALEAKLRLAFRQKHTQRAVPMVWWRRIFAGSVNVPRPAFAAALVAMTIALIAANIAGRNGAVSIAEQTVSSDAGALSSAPLPEIIERTKVVEVPVERVRVVTKVVYVEQDQYGAEKRRSGLQGARRKASDRNGHVAVRAGESDSLIQGSIAENAYFTRVSLKSFQPAEMKTRIIKEVKADEK